MRGIRDNAAYDLFRLGVLALIWPAINAGLAAIGKLPWLWLLNGILVLAALVLFGYAAFLLKRNERKVRNNIAPTTPTPARRRFGVRCGTDLYSDNILVGDIPGRYLQAQITVSESVSACKAYLREIRGGNKHWKGQEQLTFEPSEAPDSLSKALFAKIKYNLDVLLLVSTGEIVVCNHSRAWARWPRLNEIFATCGPYDLIIDIGGENAPGETFKLRFDRTGNWQTSFLTGAKRLL